MLFEDKTYLHNKEKLSKERQQEMEEKMDIYFHCIAKGVLNWETGKTSWEHSTDMTRDQISRYIGINIILEVRDSYPIGYNYDINGNKI